MKQKFSIAMSLAVILAMLLSSLALADQIVNNVAGTVDSTFEVKSFTLGDPDGTVGFYVVATGTGNNPDDGKSGCNLTGQTTLVVSVSSSNPLVATVSPSSITFTSCNTTPTAATTITVHPVAAGSTDVTLSQSSNSTGGTFDLTTARFTVNVANPVHVNTPPDVSVTGVTAGASYELGSVPQTGCSVTDVEDGPQTVSPTIGDLTGPLASYGLGAQEVTCSYTDNGGLTTAASVTYSIVDTIAPVITFVSRTPANANGWNNGDVTVTWNCTDSGSGIVSATVTETVSTESADKSVTGTCEDHAGLTASDTQSGINIDKTAPTASASASPAANNGWNNTNVTVSFSGTDALSDIDFCSADVVLSGEGAGQSASGTCTDKAGNVSAPATVSGINIDKTAPTASASVSPAANANGWNSTDVTVSFSGTDGLSGIDFCDAAVVLSSEAADQSASGTCTDKAGNVSAYATASGINIDRTAPNVSLVGGPANNGVYYFGFVPAAPSCDASDVLSGLDGSCSVSGYSDAIGTHTVIASATDKAGNSSSASATYTVNAWTLNGFFQPVDMKNVYNTVKNGSTVPLKFEIFAGPTELTDVAYVKSLTYAQTSCDATATTDEIETTATGGTSLRYDATSGQFIYNWKTPSTAGKCYRVTMTTQDGSSLVAYFKTK